MKAIDIGDALTSIVGPFHYRRYLCVPNVAWGWGLDYEADLIAVSASGRAHEIEIKVTAKDLRVDRKKAKWEEGTALDPRIAAFWYALPVDLVALAEDAAVVRPEFGILAVDPAQTWNSPRRCRIVRKARVLAGSRKCTEEEVSNLMRLGVMRYWGLRMAAMHKREMPAEDAL